MTKPPTLDDLRRYAVARTLFKPTTLGRAIDKLGFVQADPIRAPARAQDLTLRHRVAGYHAGDLERRYARLAIEEDCLVNYGFLPRRHLALMHPRVAKRAWTPATKKKAADVLAFIRERGPVHPRLVDAHFAHGRTVNAWGGSSNATTHLLDGMHYRGMLRIAAARERHPHLRSGRASAGRRQRRGAGRARCRAGRADRAQVRAAAGLELRPPGVPARLRRAAPARRDARGLGRRARLARQHAHRRRDLVLAGRREPALEALHARRARAPARAVRSDRLGPAPLRAALGLDLSLRGLHARAEAQARLLRLAAALAATASSAGATRRCATAGSR